MGLVNTLDPAAKRCITCKHWGDPADGAGPGDHRRCGVVSPDVPSETEPLNITTIAYAMDRDAWPASLMTQAEFGCVLHEPASPE